MKDSSVVYMVKTAVWVSLSLYDTRDGSMEGTQAGSKNKNVLLLRENMKIWISDKNIVSQNISNHCLLLWLFL